MLPSSSGSGSGNSSRKNESVSLARGTLVIASFSSTVKPPAHPWDAVVSAEMAAVITTLRRNQRWNIDSPALSNARPTSESPLSRKTQPYSVLGGSSTTVAAIQTFLAELAATDKRVIGSGRQVVATIDIQLYRNDRFLTRSGVLPRRDRKTLSWKVSQSFVRGWPRRQVGFYVHCWKELLIKTLT
jgi:hypothetical protein